MMVKPVGGRGKKAPYNTVVLRIPEPIANAIQEFIDRYRAKALEESEEINIEVQLKIPQLKYSHLSYSEALEEMRKILRKKKSASASMQKLLQVLYDVKEKE